MDVIRGAYDKPVSTGRLISILGGAEIEGVLYTGYPIVGALDNKNSLDAVMVTPLHGMIIFDIVEESDVTDRKGTRDLLYNAMVSRLINVKGLSHGRAGLSFKLNVLTFAPAWVASKPEDPELINTPEQLLQFIQSARNVDNLDKYERILEAIQAITKLKQRAPRTTKKDSSKGALLNEIEKSISNLDRNQSKAVIETSLGIQRIRGLAGSGKTVILALKAAYLHAKYPDWKIGVTFYSRSLKNQFKELINKFTIEQKAEEPDWDKIKIMQAWGSPSIDGFYYRFCKINGIAFHNFESARAKYGEEDILGKISSEAIGAVENPQPEFDAILIDEAQDLSESFLQLCYKLLKSSDPNNPANKRLVYAYDELQKLNKLSLRGPKEIFGDNIDFRNEPNKPLQDIILKVCYRNSAPVLVTAHGLGFGVYREVDQKINLVTMFREKELWTDVGYKVLSQSLELGVNVELARDSTTSPALLTTKVPINEIIEFTAFNNPTEQSDWIASQIIKNLTVDELEHKDIIVIHPDAYRSKSETSYLRAQLVKHGVNCHLAGVSTSADEFFVENSVAFTSIYRAKGNEAAMIYIMNTEYCFAGMELIKKRNILFTAITRSKGWVRVCGIGEGMIGIAKEFNHIKANNYHLKFLYPTEEEMNHLNVIHRELTGEEKERIVKGNDEARSLIEKLENDEIRIDDLSKELREKIKKLFE